MGSKSNGSKRVKMDSDLVVRGRDDGDELFIEDFGNEAEDEQRTMALDMKSRFNNCETQRNLLRIYPKGTRIGSSNYNPLVGWMHGAQMVALNMQGQGKHLWVTEGMFRANGGCGFVKKPDLLLNRDFDPRESLPIKTTLQVQIYMGEGWHSDFHHTHFDLYSPPDFYTRVGIAGVPADTRMMETTAIEDQWIPVWDKVFEFPLTVPELALLRIEVMEYDTSKTPDFGGQTCLPLAELRTGIRCVPLHDQKGERFKSVRLLMGFRFI
ncbi:unnamed protein product [Ilex paraguariensis]|uniref:Phosphoinositide phospholipase C n=1 Tax=Ilex paraguariensis TaxID=185542 RepID=A0ABC8R247_9AQUA